MKKILLCTVLISIFVFSSCAFATKTKVSRELPLKGQTLTNVQLQADSLMPVYMAAMTKNNPSCSTLFISNTKVLKQPHDIKTNRQGKFIAGEWEEEWTVNACGSNIYVPITFILDKTGATYSVSPNKVHF